MSDIDRIVNKEKFTAIESKIPPVNNTLTSTSTKEGLSANQGKILNDKAVSLNTNLSNYTTLNQFNSLQTTVSNLNSQISNLNNINISWAIIRSAVSSTYTDRYFKAPYADNFLFMEVTSGGDTNFFSRRLQKNEVMEYRVSSPSTRLYVFGKYSFDLYDIKP